MPRSTQVCVCLRPIEVLTYRPTYHMIDTHAFTARVLQYWYARTGCASSQAATTAFKTLLTRLGLQLPFDLPRPFERVQLATQLRV